MSLEALNDGPSKAEGNVGPAHAGEPAAVDCCCQCDSKLKSIWLLTLILLPLVDVLKVEDTGVVVVLAREDNIIHITGVSISNRMADSIPTSEACIRKQGLYNRDSRSHLHRSRPPMNAILPSIRHSFS